MSMSFKGWFQKRKKEEQPAKNEAPAELKGAGDEDITATLSLPLSEERIVQSGDDTAWPAIEAAWASEIGTRSDQQDYIEAWSAEDGTTSYTVLCDGMGGLSSGERASKLAATGMMRALQARTESLPRAMARAAAELNEQVKNLSDDQNQKIQAGTTLTAVAIEGHRMFWCSIGDSRIYLWRDRTLQQLNQDDTFGAQLDMLAQVGQITQEEALRHPKRGALTSYLGMSEIHRIGGNQNALELMPGDLILQCSDGLYRSLTLAELGALLEFVKGNLNQEVDELMEAALQKPGNHDNTSVVLIRVNH